LQESKCRHAERSGEESEAILSAQSKHPYTCSHSGNIPQFRGAHHSKAAQTIGKYAMPRDKYYCAYIMGSLFGTLYIGVSGNLHRRVFQHKFHHYEGFTHRYEVVRQLYWESYDDVHKALGPREATQGMDPRQEDRPDHPPESALDRPRVGMVPVDGVRQEDRMTVGILRLRTTVAFAPLVLRSV
jgi:predicted GIY-YIG superfamily endonuclease